MQKEHPVQTCLLNSAGSRSRRFFLHKRGQGRVNPCDNGIPDMPELRDTFPGFPVQTDGSGKSRTYIRSNGIYPYSTDRRGKPSQPGIR